MLRPRGGRRQTEVHAVPWAAAQWRLNGCNCLQSASCCRTPVRGILLPDAGRRYPATGRRSEVSCCRMPAGGILQPDAGRRYPAAGCRPVPTVCSLNKMSGLWLDCGYIRMAVRADRVWQVSAWRRFLSQHGGDAYGMHGCGQVCEPARGRAGLRWWEKLRAAMGCP